MVVNIKDYMDESLISDLFKGKLCAEYICDSCEFRELVEEDFMGLSLTIPK